MRIFYSFIKAYSRIFFVSGYLFFLIWFSIGIWDVWTGSGLGFSAYTLTLGLAGLGGLIALNLFTVMILRALSTKD